MVALYDLELEQLDVKTSFLHGDLEEKIYIEQLEDFKVEGKENHICLLKRSFYSLKQSLRQWNRRFDSFVLRIGYMGVCMILVSTTEFWVISHLFY